MLFQWFAAEHDIFTAELVSSFHVARGSVPYALQYDGRNAPAAHRTQVNRGGGGSYHFKSKIFHVMKMRAAADIDREL